MNEAQSKVRGLGTILSLWAHPDDETFFCAGIMAMAVQNGQTVICVTATNGEAGVQNAEKWPPETLGQTRQAELMAALKLIGINQHHWLDFADGRCSQVNENEAAQKILQLVHQYRPDTILTFGPDGITGHPDHQTVSRWVDQVAKQLDKKPVVYHAVELQDKYEKYLKVIDEEFNMYFNIDKPPILQPEDCALYVELPDDLRKTKCNMLRCMPSQTAVLIDAFGEDFLCKALGKEAFVRAK